MPWFQSCQNCGGLVLFHRHESGGVFCSSVCRQFHNRPGFCEACLKETHEVGAGGTRTVNGFGTSLLGRSAPCPNCGSVIQRLFACALFIPILPLGRFRVKHCSPGHYFSRRMRKAGEPYVSLASAALEDEGHKLLAEASLKPPPDREPSSARSSHQRGRAPKLNPRRFRSRTRCEPRTARGPFLSATPPFWW